MNQSSAVLVNHTGPQLSNRGVLVITVTGKPKLPAPVNNGMSNQGVATLIVMCCVLTIIMLFCCLAAPGIRDLCKRYVFRTCVIDDPEVNNVPSPQQSSTPTLILLPFGRMLVVDRSMFQSLQIDPAGLDFLELSRQIIRNHSFVTGSTPSALDYESTSKGLTPDSLDMSPPAYEDIFKKDLPPAYSELSLMFRTGQTRTRRSSSCRSTESNLEMAHVHEQNCEAARVQTRDVLISKM